MLFTDMDSALRDYPDLVKEYFGTIIPANDNKFAALNTAVWSADPSSTCRRCGGRHPAPGLLPDQRREHGPVRADADHRGRGLLRALRRGLLGADLHERLAALRGGGDRREEGARVRYTTIQNWSTNVYNLVTKRAAAHEDAGGVIDGNIGSKVTMKYPSIYLLGKGAREVLSVAFAGKGMHTDAGGKAIHAAPYTTSAINQVGLEGRRARATAGSSGWSRTPITRSRPCAATRRSLTRRAAGHLPVHRGRGRDGRPRTRGNGLEGRGRPALLPDSRGLSEAEATAMIVNGFIEPITGSSRWSTRSS